MKSKYYDILNYIIHYLVELFEFNIGIEVFMLRNSKNYYPLFKRIIILVLEYLLYLLLEDMFRIIFLNHIGEQNIL